MMRRLRAAIRAALCKCVFCAPQPPARNLPRMPDLADQADAQQQTLLDQYRARRAPVGPEPDGQCHYCRQPVGPDRRWCDRECFLAWEDEQDLLRRTGRRHPGR